MVLIEALKIYLDITWNDPHTNAKLEGILERAQAKINAYAGTTLSFEDGTVEQQLLLDCCRYIWNNASEDFEDNYRADLLLLRAQKMTEVLTDESETEDTNAGS